MERGYEIDTGIRGKDEGEQPKEINSDQRD